MGFGFDPSIILAGLKNQQPWNPEETLQTLSNLATQRQQQQMGQVQIADLLRKQGQEQTLASILQAHAGSMPAGLPRDLASAGLGQQAMAWQDQETEQADKKAEQAKKHEEVRAAQRKYVGELFYGKNDQAGYDAAIKELRSHPDGSVSMYADMLPPKFDAGVVERLGNMAVPAETRAKLAARDTPAGQVIVADDGTQYVADKRTGAATAVRDDQGNAIKARPKGGRGAGGGGAGGGDRKDWKDLQSALSTGARGSLNKDIQKSLNSAEALEALLKLPNGRLVDATPQQMHEAYTSLNNLISKGGSQAASQIEALVPETLASKWANLKQTILNEPQGADAKAFIENILDTTARETKLARKQLRRQQLQAVPNFAHLRKADKTRFESMLRAPGVEIDPASLDENGLEVPNTPAAPAPGAWGDADESRLQELERKAGAKK